jgi:iron(III) transport system substrate-binding protein
MTGFGIRKKRMAAGAALAFAGFLAISAVSTASAKEAWEATWDKLVAAAKKEGVVVVSGPPGAFQRQAITSAWAKAYPGIRLEYTGARGTQIIAKVVRERTSGIYNWDVVLASTSPTVFSLVPINALAPLRDAIVRPDILDDKTWVGGFESGFMDKEKKYFFNAMGTAGQALGYANRDCVSKDVFSKSADMMKPELKGKIVWYDPTRPGTGSRGTWVLSLAQGKDWLKNLYQNQGVIFSRDYRQMTDFLVSCRVSVAIGMPNDVLEQMQKQGIGKNVEELSGPAYFGKYDPGGAGGNESIGWYNNAPHSNAAKVFVNWYLSREFQQTYAAAVKDNSRRVDTKPQDSNPAHTMKQGIAYHNWANEEATVEIKALQEEIRGWGVLKGLKGKKKGR